MYSTLTWWELDVPTRAYVCVHRNPQPAFGIYSLRQSKDLYVGLVSYQPWRVQRQPCVLLMDKIWTAANPKVNPMHLKHFIRQLSFLSFFLSLSFFFFFLSCGSLSSCHSIDPSRREQWLGLLMCKLIVWALHQNVNSPVFLKCQYHKLA